MSLNVSKTLITRLQIARKNIILTQNGGGNVYIFAPEMYKTHLILKKSTFFTHKYTDFM